MMLEIDADPAKHTVTMRMHDEVIELTFTDKPVKPTPAAAKGAGRQKARRGPPPAAQLLKALLGVGDE